MPLYYRDGSIPAYLLLTAFDLALGLVLIVGTTRDRGNPTTVDPRATVEWLGTEPRLCERRACRVVGMARSSARSRARVLPTIRSDRR